MKRFTIRLTALLLGAVILTSMILMAFAAPMASYIGIVKARGGLRLRSEANTSSTTLTIAPYGDNVVVLEKDGNWCKVNYNLQIGYMSADYLTLKERENIELGTGSIDGSVVNMRSGPSTGYSTVTQLSRGSKVEIFGFNCGWYKVRTAADKIGYIRSDLLELLDKPLENQGVASSSSNSSSSSGSNSSSSNSSSSGSSSSRSAGQKLADYAVGYVGCSYVYGGTSPSGFDCSGFMQYVARNNGITIQRTATAQLQNGTYVARSDLQPGDLVFFGYGSTASHVGMYIGDGKFVHAQNSSTGVVITSLSQNYYDSRYLTARRIVD